MTAFRRLSVLAATLALSPFLPTSAPAFQNMLDFEGPAVSDPPPPASIAFANRGVLLPSNRTAHIVSLPSATSPVATRSGTHALISAPIYTEFDPRPLIIEFTAPVSWLSFYTGSPADTRGQEVTVVAEALDGNNQPVTAARTVSFIGPTNIVHLIQMADPQNHFTIKRLRIDAIQAMNTSNQTGTYEYVDDLSFTTEAQPPVLAQEPPHVYITEPPNGISSGTGQVTLEGDIVGKGLLPDIAPPTIDIQWPADPSASSPKQEIQLALGSNLAWTVPDQSLHVSRSMSLEHFGQNALTVRAFNAAGVGQAVRTVQVLPQSIQDEYDKQPNRFGGIIEGQTTGTCSWAVYTNGAIFSSPKGTFSSIDDSFSKWNKLRIAGGTGLLGCAIGPNERPKGHRWGAPKGTTVSIDDAWAQDFERGRIYSGPKGAYYVTQPFLDAMAKLDFAVNFGIPVTDPETRNQPLLPTRWQRFEPTKDTDYFGNLGYSTMEMTGTPLKLWIATPDTLGWIKVNYEGAIMWPGQHPPDNSDALMTVPRDLPARLPTVWRSYTCPKQDEPCLAVGAVASEDVANYGPPLDYNDVYAKCGDYSYPLGGTPAWAGFYDDTYELIPVQGNAASSHLAGEDFTECHFCSRTDLAACIVGSLFGAPVACAYVDEGVDWNVKLAPSPGQEYVLGVNRWETPFPLGKVKRDDQSRIEIEYEWCLVGYPFKFGHNPIFPNKLPIDYIQKGDGLFVAGRWIVDCGHKPYNTEIHPPAVIVDWHTEPGTTPGELATFADMTYLDWWWPNQAVSVDLYPPPRPNPDVRLAGQTSVWQSGVKTSWLPAGNPNHVRLELTGRADIPADHFPPYIASNGQVHHGCWALKAYGIAYEAAVLQGYPPTLVEALKCDDTKRSIWGFYRLEWQ